MLIKRGGGFKDRDVTPYDLYLNRRAFIFGAAAAALAPRIGEASSPPAGQTLQAAPNPAYRLEDPPTPLKDVTSYNNFYEFGVNKEDPARLAGTLKTRPWTVKVDGLCAKPKIFDIDMCRCMYCGLCEEACPEEAIVMSSRIEISAFSRRATLWRLATSGRVVGADLTMTKRE